LTTRPSLGAWLSLRIISLPLTTAELKKPYILVTEKKLSKISDLMEVLKAINDEGRRPGEGLLIIGDVVGDALNMLIANKMNKAVISVAVSAPMVGDQSTQSLEDLALYTGARFITNSDSMDLRCYCLFSYSFLATVYATFHVFACSS